MKNKNIGSITVAWIMFGLNVLSIVLGIIPGFLKMYDKQTNAYIPGSLLSIPSSNIMKNVAPLLLIVFAYCLIVSVIYLRGQSLAAIRGYFVGTIATCVLTLMAILPDKTVADWPYVIIPAIWGIQIVVSGVMMITEKRRLDRLEELEIEKEQKQEQEQSILEKFGF